MNKSVCFVSPITRQPLALSADNSCYRAADGHESWPIIEGIPDFNQYDDSPFYGEVKEFGAAVLNGPHVEQNLDAHRERFESQERWYAQIINEDGGLTLEVAAGPGGGNVPAILFDNPNACVLMSDICLGVVLKWKRVLHAFCMGPHVSFAAFNAQRMPLADCSIDTVSGVGGITEAGGEPTAREVSRVLKPGGLLVDMFMSLNEGELARFPEEFRAKRGGRGTSYWKGFLERLEFEVIKVEPLYSRYFAPGESTLANEATAYGLPLSFTDYLIIAHKR